MATGLGKKIMQKSRREYLTTRELMRKANHEVNNSVAKGVGQSNHVPTSKSMKHPIGTSRFGKCLISMEEPKALSRSTGKGKENFKQTHALKRKGETNDVAQPTMQGLVQKTTNRLGHDGDLSSRSKKQASPDKEHITGAKLELSKVHILPKESSMNGSDDRQDGIVIANNKDNAKSGEYHMEGNTTKANHTLNLTVSDIHFNSKSISSNPVDRNLPKSLRDNDSMNLTFENVEKRGERNTGQFANCNGKNSNSMSKKGKEPLPVENPETLGDDSNVGVQVDNMSCKQMNKLKQSRVTRKDEAEDGSGDLNHVGVEDDIAIILKNGPSKLSVSSCLEQQCYSCSKPIDKPIWSGIFKIDDKEYASLDGHLSTKSCEKAWSLSRQLHQVIEAKKVSRSEVWPKACDVSKPIADDIAIYFFPHEMRQDEDLDEIVREVMQKDLALQAITGEAEMLILSSILLPHRHQTFQGKHYLWGVFKHRKDKGGVVEESLNVVGRYEMEKEKNVVSDQPNLMLPSEEPNQEMIRMASVIPLERHMLPPNKSTQEVEANRLKGPSKNGFDLKTPGEEVGHAETTPVTADAATFPASYGQINPSMGHTPDNLMGFVVRKTPKIVRIIEEIEQEGALVIAIQEEMFGAGSTTMQN